MNLAKKGEAESGGINRVGVPPTLAQLFKTNAVVIGGSIAGMFAARVLAEYFSSVTIIETDKLPDCPIARKGVPQSVQPHVLLTRGYRILEELFPGIGSQLDQAGALRIDWAREFYNFTHGGWSAKAECASDLVSFTCSRPLLESTIRRRLFDFPNVKFVEQHKVTGLLVSSNHITGVSLRSTNGEDHLSATFVVDASGRRSQAPEWLKNLGFTPPPQTIVNPYLGYATRRYREPKEWLAESGAGAVGGNASIKHPAWRINRVGVPPTLAHLFKTADWKVMLISHSPPNGTRLGYLAKIEGKEWIATLGGYGRDFPPLDDAGFLEFARSLPSSEFYEAIKQAEPVSPIYAHRATTNRLRHYEKILLPEGFVCLGDAVCALCPVYGQGMTISALSAMVLKQELKSNRFTSTRFQKNLASSNSLPWALATAQDSRFPTTTRLPAIQTRNTKLGKLMQRKVGVLIESGFPRLSPNFLRQWYSKRLLSGANSDSTLNTLTIEVAHLLKSPLAFYHPKVILRVLSDRARLSFIN